MDVCGCDHGGLRGLRGKINFNLNLICTNRKGFCVSVSRVRLRLSKVSNRRGVTLMNTHQYTTLTYLLLKCISTLLVMSY